MSKLKIAFLGCKPFGESCLQYLLETYSDRFDIKFICSNQEANNWWKSNRCYELADHYDIPFIDNKKRNEDQMTSLLQEHECDYLFSIQHPWILSDKIIKRFKNAFNFHNAKLPEYKGHNCCNHAIINGENFYTTTVHYLIPEVDSGDIIFETQIPIYEEETAQSLYKKSNDEAFKLFVKLLDKIIHGESLPARPQTGKEIFYPRNSLDNYKDLTNCEDREKIDRIKRALFFPPFDGAYIIKNGNKEYL